MRFDGTLDLSVSTELHPLLDRYPPADFDRGETLIRDSLGGNGSPGTAPLIGYVVEGLVRGSWNCDAAHPKNRVTVMVAGDGHWIGIDSIRHGRNLLRYEAVTPTTAAILPLAAFREEAPREVLIDLVNSVSGDWATTASLVGMHNDTLRRRALLLFCNLVRHHPRPEIEVRQKDVADLLGVARQTLHPVLKVLEKDGLIELGYGEIFVGDADALVTELRRTA